jgi:hypothetical protein
MTVMIEATRAIMTQRTAAQRYTNVRTPAGSRRNMLKYYDARHQDLLEGGVLPDAPPESKRERWWVAKMTLHCRGDRVVFTLVKLRWVAQHMTTAAVEIFWDGLGREGCCRCKFACVPACAGLPACAGCLRVQGWCRSASSQAWLLPSRAAEQATGGRAPDTEDVPGGEHTRDNGDPDAGGRTLHAGP